MFGGNNSQGGGLLGGNPMALLGLALVAADDKTGRNTSQAISQLMQMRQQAAARSMQERQFELEQQRFGLSQKQFGLQQQEQARMAQAAMREAEKQQRLLAAQDNYRKLVGRPEVIPGQVQPGQTDITPLMLKHDPGEGVLGGKMTQDQFQMRASPEFFQAGDTGSAYNLIAPRDTGTPLTKNLMAAGLQPGTKQFQDAILAAEMKPGVSVNTGSHYNIPSGFMLKDSANPALGVTPIPGSDKDTLTPEQAAKVQMMRTAQNQLPAIQKLLFKKNGEPNRKIVANMQEYGPFEGTPFTTGRMVRNMYDQGIQAITRGETGAAMPASELNNTRSRFMPSIGDNDKQITTKWNMFNDFIGGSLKLIDNAGRFDAERFQSEYQRRLGGEGQKKSQSSQPAGLNNADIKSDPLGLR